MPDSPDPVPRLPNDELAELFVAHAHALVAWLRFKTSRMPGARFGVEDVAQEVWLRAVAKHASFDPKRSSFRTWLFGIAANVFLELRKRSLRLSRVRINEGHSTMVDQLNEITDTITSITGRIARSDAMNALFAEVERHDEVDQKVFQLRGLEERPHAEVADLLGLSLEAVTKRWNRLLASLRQHDLPSGLLAQ